MPTTGYARRLIELIEELLRDEADRLDEVAQRCADALGDGALVHLFGSGHSVLPVLDSFPRYGSFIGLSPLTDPRLMWHNVLGPGGTRELQWLERAEGYVRTFLDHRPLGRGDVMICFSHGGTTAAPIEAAEYAAARGLTTVAVTSLREPVTPARHSSGRRLEEVCDLFVDTHCPVADAIVDVPGWPRPTGGAASALQIVVVQEIITRTAAAAASRGLVLPTLASPTVPGVTLATNDEVFDAHQRYVRAAQERQWSEWSEAEAQAADLSDSSGNAR